MEYWYLCINILYIIYEILMFLYIVHICNIFSSDAMLVRCFFFFKSVLFFRVLLFYYLISSPTNHTNLPPVLSVCLRPPVLLALCLREKHPRNNFFLNASPLDKLSSVGVNGRPLCRKHTNTHTNQKKERERESFIKGNEVFLGSRSAPGVCLSVLIKLVSHPLSVCVVVTHIYDFHVVGVDYPSHRCVSIITSEVRE